MTQQGPAGAVPAGALPADALPADALPGAPAPAPPAPPPPVSEAVAPADDAPAAEVTERPGGSARSAAAVEPGTPAQADTVSAPASSGGEPPRRRFSWSAARQVIPPVLEPLCRVVREAHPKADLPLLARAYEVAETYHQGQYRKSGDPYITHPLAVATILAELGMNVPTLCAALLHDTVEDTEYTLERLRSDFGDEIASLVDGVTKLDKVKYGQAAQAETVRKMVIAMARDIRVLVIKLCDRLHNARTWRYVSHASAERKARETLEIYAPLAHRLGMNTIKWELEDLSFATLYPKMYDEIVRLVADRAPSRDDYLDGVTAQVMGDLREARIKATVTGRPKHYYSVYQKMIVRGHDFGDIYDLVGLRVLVDSVRDCYAALGAVHARWNPVPGRFKDYIAMPKFNMYQSLHTTVIGPEGKPVELQIRTHAMHRRAEYGIAAHWKYKGEGQVALGSAKGRSGEKADRVAKTGFGDSSPDDMAWVRALLDWQKETSDPGEFLESLRFDLSTTEVYVFTPKGDVQALPAGSTPVDFAYAVHTEVGHRCIGARVNGRLVPLESKLDNGDVVEVFTSKATGAGPSQDWLGFVASPRARSKIRQWFSKERREEAIDHGKDAIARAMRKQNLPLQRLLTTESLTVVARELRYPDISALYAAVWENHVSAQAVVQRFVSDLGGEEAAAEDLAEVTRPDSSRTAGRIGRPGTDPGVVVRGVSDVWVKLARCCMPVPGDAILGFVTRGSGVSVHRADCTNARALTGQGDRVVEVEWAPTSSSLFMVSIQVEALDRSRLLSDVTRVLSDYHLNILSATVNTRRDRVAINRFTFEMGDPKHLGHVLRAVRNVEGVFDAYRITSTTP
jgi:guanosine-3',5'-bis(diphosphate) 3'-pyrophosphohydrolase